MTAGIQYEVPEIQPPDLAALLKAEMTDAVRAHESRRPRSTQVAIGPSELGNPCDRKLALKSQGHDGGAGTLGPSPDPWAAVIGTSIHSYLESVFRELDWLTEQRVEIAPGILGTADLYHRDTVIDHKVPADTTIDKVRKGIISETYKVQVQTYGYGFARVGYDVENVAIAFWPRGKGAWLGGVEIWTDTYRPEVATAALERWYEIVNAAIQLDLGEHLERAELFATADGPCSWCPFLNNLCKGHRK